MPVMLPRESDADMRRDGSATTETVPIQPSMSAEECTAHQILIPARDAPPFADSIVRDRIRDRFGVVWRRRDDDGQSHREEPKSLIRRAR